MKISAIFLVVSCIIHQIVTQNYRGKNNVRGLSRPPAYQGFVKKWEQLQMSNLRGRPRPKPIHQNTQKHKKPFQLNNSVNRLIKSPPVRPFWQNSKNTHRTSTEKSVFIQPTEKYSYILPNPKQKPLIKKEYNFHIQTNQIPSGISSTHQNPIQQVGEQGPIHTIPAPNLSPADKPTNIQHMRHQIQSHNFKFDSEKQLHHEYHVTEPSEALKLFRSNPKSQQNMQYHSKNEQTYYFNPQLFRNSEQEVSEIPPKSQGVDNMSQRKPSEFYETVQQHQQENSESEEIPHQQFLQQFPKYHLLVPDDSQEPKPQQSPSHEQHDFFIAEVPQQNQQQVQYPQQSLFFSDQNFVHQFQQLQKQPSPPRQINLSPELHSFNYNEQDYQKQNSKSSSVSSSYHIDTEPESSEIFHQTMARTPGDVLAESQFVQNFFESKEQDLGTNNVEPDSKLNQEKHVLKDNGEEEEMSQGFFSALPNKDVADALASLQAAGKINSNLMQLTNRGLEKYNQMKISVSEESNDSEELKNDGYESLNSAFEDYEPTENDDEKSDEEMMNTSFGDKIKPKRTSS